MGSGCSTQLSPEDMALQAQAKLAVKAVGAARSSRMKKLKEQEALEREAEAQAVADQLRKRDTRLKAAREEVVVTSAGARTLDDLPPSIRVLHTGMPQSAKRADMRLLKLPAVLAWPQLRLYEDVVPGEEALTLPYEDVSEEQWQATVVLSWRWSAGKPAEMVPGFSPMSAQQFEELQRLLRCAAAGGLQYTWIDWCCVPQYSAPSMVEVLRSKVYYARARTMLVLPTFAQLPATTCTPIKQQLQAAIGRMKDASVSLAKASTKLAASAEKKEGEEDGGKAEGQEKASKEGEGAEGKAGEGSDEAKAAAALVNQRVVAAVVEDLLAKGLYADGAYFGRAWTLAERMARFGRRECLCQWMSLEVWLGMALDAVLSVERIAAGVEAGAAEAAAGHAADGAAHQRKLRLHKRLQKQAGVKVPELYNNILGKAGPMLVELLDTLLEQLKPSFTGKAEAPTFFTEEEEAAKAASAAPQVEALLVPFLLAAGEVWAGSVIPQEAPARAWLRKYLRKDIARATYAAFNRHDLVWAVYSYFSYEQAASSSVDAVARALQELRQIAAGKGDPEPAPLACPPAMYEVIGVPAPPPATVKLQTPPQWFNARLEFDVKRADINLWTAHNEKLLSSMARVKDAQGDNPYGDLRLSNMRLTWSQDGKPSVNIVIGLDTIRSATLPDEAGYQLVVDTAGKTGKESKESNFQFVFMTGPAAEGGAPRADFHAFNDTLQDVLARCRQTKLFRMLKLRAAMVTGDFDLLPGEQLYRRVHKVENFGGNQRHAGTMLITDVRLMWYSLDQPTFNASIPFMHVKGVSVTPSAAYSCEALLVEITESRGGYRVGFGVGHGELAEVKDDIHELWQAYLARPLMGVAQDAD